MNITAVDEPIRVLAAFSGGGVQPLQFHWAGRAYEIEAVNGHWLDRARGGLCLHFSVQAGEETFYLHFNAHDVQWWLDQVAAE